MYRVLKAFGPFAAGDIVSRFGSNNPLKPVSLRVNEEKQMNVTEEQIQGWLQSGHLTKFSPGGGGSPEG